MISAGVLLLLRGSPAPDDESVGRPLIAVTIALHLYSWRPGNIYQLVELQELYPFLACRRALHE